MLTQLGLMDFANPWGMKIGQTVIVEKMGELFQPEAIALARNRSAMTDEDLDLSFCPKRAPLVLALHSSSFSLCIRKAQQKMQVSMGLPLTIHSHRWIFPQPSSSGVPSIDGPFPIGWSMNRGVETTPLTTGK